MTREDKSRSSEQLLEEIDWLVCRADHVLVPVERMRMWHRAVRELAEVYRANDR